MKGSSVSFKANMSSLIFCLVDFSRAVNGVLKLPWANSCISLLVSSVYPIHFKIIWGYHFLCFLWNFSFYFPTYTSRQAQCFLALEEVCGSGIEFVCKKLQLPDFAAPWPKHWRFTLCPGDSRGAGETVTLAGPEAMNGWNAWLWDIQKGGRIRGQCVRSLGVKGWTSQRSDALPLPQLFPPGGAFCEALKGLQWG